VFGPLRAHRTHRTTPFSLSGAGSCLAPLAALAGGRASSGGRAAWTGGGAACGGSGGSAAVLGSAAGQLAARSRPAEQADGHAAQLVPRIGGLDRGAHASLHNSCSHAVF